MHRASYSRNAISRRALVAILSATLSACATLRPIGAVDPVAQRADHSGQSSECKVDPVPHLSVAPLLALVGLMFGAFHGGPSASAGSGQRDAVIGAAIGGVIGLWL